MKQVFVCSFWFVAGVALLLGVATEAVTHDGEDRNHNHHSKPVNEGSAVNSGSVTELLSRLHRVHGEVTRSVAAGSLSSLHQLSEEFLGTVEALRSNPRVEDVGRVTGFLNNLKRVADELHHSGDNNSQAGAQAAIGQLEKLLPLLYARYKFNPADNKHPVAVQHPVGEGCVSPDVTVSILSKQYSFEPSEIKVKRGKKVCLKLASADVEHGIMIDAYHVHVHGKKDAPGEVQFVADRPGKFNFICHQVCGSGHGDMKGWLIVE